MKVVRVKSFDGLTIYSEALGTGYPFVCCNGVGVSTFFWTYIQEYFRNKYKLILWDYRGHGKSEAPIATYRHKFRDHIRDLNSVMEGHKVDSTILFGHSLGVQLTLEYYLNYPDKIKGLVLILGSFGKAMSYLFDSKLSLPIFKFIHKQAKTHPEKAKGVWKFLSKNPFHFEVAKLLVISKVFGSARDMAKYFNHLFTLDVNIFLDMISEMENHSVLDFLPKITVPTLIIAGESDVFTPIHLSHEMAKLIPKSELTVIPKGSHAAIVEHPALINLRIEKFLRDNFEKP